MALPSSFGTDDGTIRTTGIVLSIVPLDATFGAEIQRSSDLGGGAPASSAALSIAQFDYLPVSGTFYLDAQAADAQSRFYRGRGVGPGVAPSCWTPWTTASTPGYVPPKYLQGVLLADAVYPLVRGQPMADGQYALASATTTGTQPSSALYLASTQALIVGTTATPSAVTKLIQIGPHRLRPRSPATTAYDYTGTALNVPWSAAWPLVLYFFADVTFPPGVTITNLSARLFGATSAGGSTSSNLQLVRDDDEVTGVAIATLALARGAAGWQTGAAAVSQLVSSTQSYTLALQALMSSGGNQALGQVAITYTMPSYDKGY